MDDALSQASLLGSPLGILFVGSTTVGAGLKEVQRVLSTFPVVSSCMGVLLWMLLPYIQDEACSPGLQTLSQGT